LAIFTNSNIEVISQYTANDRSHKDSSREGRKMHDEDVMLIDGVKRNFSGQYTYLSTPAI